MNRSPDGPRLQVFDAAQLDALSELPAEMGYDRGELVSAVGLWLVVEGETDQVVLDTLYGDELRRAGIEVVPLHGTANWQLLLDADALWRFTIAPVAVMFDGISAARVEELAKMPAADLDAFARSGAQRNEERDLANLLKAGRNLGRQIHPVPNEGSDIFQLLDENAIRTEFGDYPGHADAQKAWEKHKKGTRDAFMKRKYEVVKAPDRFGAIAAEMKAKGVSSPALDAAIAFCRALAL
jgi:hypothetical protein